MKLQGIFVDMATPFDHEGRLYRSKIQYNVSKYCLTSAAGLIAGGAAGEGRLLTVQEKAQLFRLVKEASSGDRILLAGVDRAGVEESVEVARAAHECAFDAVVAYAPRFDERADACASIQTLYFQSLADRSPLPVIVVNASLPADAVLAVTRHPNVAGVVDSFPDRIAALVAEGVRVLCGAEQAFWASLKRGASGGALAVASAAPYAAIAIWEAFRTREEEAGVDWQERIEGPSSLIAGPGGIGALKQAMDLNGYYGGRPRLPLRPLAQSERDEVSAAFRNLKS